MNSQECKVSPEVFSVNSDEPVFFHFSAKTSKCRGSCNDKMIDTARVFRIFKTNF